MFSNPIPLNRENHRHLCYKAARHYGFAATLSATPVLSSEADHVAREYVLVFPAEADQPLRALLASEEGVNAYVGRSSNEPAWLARYVPAQLRRYPFVSDAARATDMSEEERLTVFIDGDAPQLAQGAGERLFTDAGEPTQVLERIQRGLSALHRDLLHTRWLVNQIDDAGLLVEQDLRLERGDGQATTFAGVRVVDTARVDALDAAALKGLHDSGALALIHAHRLSMTNLADSVLAKRAARPTPDRPASGTTRPAGLGSFADESETISFDQLDNL